MQLADLLIHVDQQLDAAAREELEEGLREVDGVVAPRFHTNTPHLLLVAYNPANAQPRTLLETVTGRGYSAQLIGM